MQQIAQNSGIPMPPNIVSVNTNLVDFDIELFRSDTPGTVTNFLKYINDGDYNNSIMHRFNTNFVLQGGGFKTNSTTYSNTSQFSSVPTDPAIQNEYKISNTAGTIAMAKLERRCRTAPPASSSSIWATTRLTSTTRTAGLPSSAALLDNGLLTTLNGLFTATDAGGTFTELPTGRQFPIDGLRVVCR